MMISIAFAVDLAALLFVSCYLHGYATGKRSNRKD